MSRRQAHAHTHVACTSAVAAVLANCHEGPNADHRPAVIRQCAGRLPAQAAWHTACVHLHGQQTVSNLLCLSPAVVAGDKKTITHAVGQHCMLLPIKHSACLQERRS